MSALEMSSDESTPATMEVPLINTAPKIPKIPTLDPSPPIGAPQSYTLLSTAAFEITPTLSPKLLPIVYNVPAPPTPPASPATLSPKTLRYPDTLGTLIEIRNSEYKGLGMFALCDILPGTILLSEAPIVTLRDNRVRGDSLDITINALSPEKKKSFFSLHAYSHNEKESRIKSIAYSNGYSIMDDLATGVFEIASRINHSCVPNSHYFWKDRIGRMVFWNRFKLLEGEELTVDYGHNKAYLKKIYGFDCECGGCTESGSGTMSSNGSNNGREEELLSIDKGLPGGKDKGKEKI